MSSSPNRNHPMVALVCALGIIGVLVRGSAFGATISVAPDGSGDYPTIQAALDAAGAGDVIELANGDFAGEGNYLLDPQGKEVAIRSHGGNPELCRIFSSDAGGPWGGQPCFDIHSGEGPSLIIEGITLQAWAHGTGGGTVQVHDSSPVFRNCRFVESHVETLGGAVACYGLSVPQFEQCEFSGNSTLGPDSYGGAVALSFGGRFESCVFRDNAARSSGAVFCHYTPPGGSVEFESCLFVENYATEGANGAIGGGAAPRVLVIRNSTFYGNVSEYQAAAVGYASELTNCVITKCGSYTYSTGGWIVGSVGAVSCTDIWGNYNGQIDESWDGVLAAFEGINGNFSLDPQFCGPEDGNFYLQSDSPCAPSNNSCGTQIGALPIGCETVSTNDASWGAIKALY